jgi:hypothetical protein
MGALEVRGANDGTSFRTNQEVASMSEQTDKARKDFVTEGLIEVGPRANFFTFVDGEFLGRMLCHYAGVGPKENEYTRLGRARITVEWLEDEAVGDSSPT